jgi:penicillin-binding protein 1C
MSPYSFKRFYQKVTNLKWVLPVKRFVIAVGVLFASFLLLNKLAPLPDRIDYTTVVTDESGEVIHAFLTGDEKWRMKTELSEISPLLRKTIIAKEDKYFYSHWGINPFAVVRAGANNALQRRRTSGASTITMQVARALEKRPRSIGAKLVEAFRALQLEWAYSKDEILQLYLNLVPYGGNIEGVKAAAYLYFHKAPDHLSLAEITALSIIPNRPSSLVIGRHNDRIVAERNKWLHRFAREGVFTPKEIEDALAEPLHAQRSAVPRYVPHLAWKLKRESSNPVIPTHIRLNTQLKIEKLTADYIRTLRLQNIRNAAIVVMDNRTRKVVAYVGSADFRDTTDGGQVNGAAAIRQPGSTLKPLLYGLCFDEGLLTPKMVISDVAVNYNGYAPENYDQKFNGYVTVEQALERSLNIPSVKGLQLLGKERMIGTLVEANFRQVAKDQNKLGLSLVLGGCGTTLEQLTALFSAFANGGVYSPARFRQGDSARKGVRLLSAPATYMITDILSRINRPDFPLNWGATEHMPKIAWKTGTSYGRRDAWSIGYNKAYTVGVWVGNFSAQGVPELSGANTATPLLFKVFNTIDYDNSEWFAPPTDLDWRQVCSESGLPPGPHCTNLVLDPFIPLISATTVCQHLQEVKVSADGAYSYCSACAPASGYTKKLYRSMAPEMQDYFRQNGRAFASMPAHNPACEKIFRGEGPAITAPQNGAEYYISKSDPEPLQLSANTASDVSKVYWYINDHFYKAAAAGEKLFFLPEEGPLKISCTDDKGRNRNIRIRVNYVVL